MVPSISFREELHAIEASCLGIGCGLAIVINDPGNVIPGRGAGLFIGFAPGGGVGMIRRGRGRGRERGLAAEVIGMDDPAHVPQLHHDPPAGLVDGIDVATQRTAALARVGVGVALAALAGSARRAGVRSPTRTSPSGWGFSMTGARTTRSSPMRCS